MARCHPCRPSARLPGRISPDLYRIEIYEELCNDISKLLLSGDLSDVTIMLYDKKCFAHKLILAARSEYFRKYFTENPDCCDVDMGTCPSSSFKHILGYVYSGIMDLQDQPKERAMEIKRLLKKYEIASDFDDGFPLPDRSTKKGKEEIHWIAATVSIVPPEMFDKIASIVNTNESTTERLFDFKEHIKPYSKGSNEHLAYVNLKLSTLRAIQDYLVQYLRRPHFIDIRNPKLLSRQLCTLVNGNTMPFDITFVVEGKRFGAHKILVIARSLYFRTMLKSTGFAESGRDEIELQDGTAAAFRSILLYMYSGRMDYNPHNIQEIINVFCLAHLYKMDELVETLTNAFEICLSTQNFVVTYELANFYALTSLTNKCNAFIATHSLEIVAANEFLEMSASCVEAFMLTMRNNSDLQSVVNALMRWLNANMNQLTVFISIINALELTWIRRNGTVRIITAEPLAEIPAEQWDELRQLSNT
ncbi:BTB/POZ domain-containing protein [Ditylenchus destructor]|nr:BTB/POZ domain-containing protein [Ditylenchus destructor]